MRIVRPYLAVASPIDLGDGDGHGPIGRAAATAGEDEKSNEHARPSTSNLWLNYEKIFKTVNGEKVGYEVKCLHCVKVYSLLFLVVALVTSPNIGIDALTGVKKSRLSPQKILIWMVVCIIGSTVLRLLVLYFVD